MFYMIEDYGTQGLFRLGRQWPFALPEPDHTEFVDNRETEEEREGDIYLERERYLAKVRERDT